MAATKDQWAEEEQEAATVERRKNIIFSAAQIIGTYHLEYMANNNMYRQHKESGYEWVMRTLQHKTQCFNMFRMDREVFDSLHNLLVESYGLKSTTKMTSVESC